MTFTLRPYQQAAVDAAINYMRTHLDPALLEAATGAGKSLLVAEIAKWIHERSQKKVLCLAPSKELVEQNAEKYRAYGYKASFWSASVGKKSMLHSVVFGTPTSVLNDIEHFGEQFAGIIIDEAHGITPTIIKIVDAMKDRNGKLRIIGLTATPYRLGSGYIYRIGIDGQPVPETQTRNPFFAKLLYRITARELIDQGFLTPPVADLDLAQKYDTSELQINSRGQFYAAEVERAFEGHGRLTSAIIEQVVDISRGKMGVMFFAATIQHAQEVMASLPPDNARLVTGETPKPERQRIIDDFKAQRFKYLVNVAVLTTGFDAPHVDVIAILRATESAGLLQQIIGRGLRLHPDKATSLVLDYAGNIERHGLEEDLFSPEIKAYVGSGGDLIVDAECVTCGTVNQFSGRPNPDDLKIDQWGYFLDLQGNRIEVEGQPMPAHYGRRCWGQIRQASGHYERCDNRWSHKICPECEAENDMAARYCSECKHELIDPNEKLALDFKRMKADPRALSTDPVRGWKTQEWISQKGNVTLRVDYTTDYRTFSVWYSHEGKSQRGILLWESLCEAVFGPGHIAPDAAAFVDALRAGHGTMPTTITARKEGDFFRVFAHNMPADEEPR